MLAERLDGPTAAGWADLAGRLGVTLVGGICELGDDGLLYNTAVVISGAGLRAAYRKAHLWDAEKLVLHAGRSAATRHRGRGCACRRDDLLRPGVPRVGPVARPSVARSCSAPRRTGRGFPVRAESGRSTWCARRLRPASTGCSSPSVTGSATSAGWTGSAARSSSTRTAGRSPDRSPAMRSTSSSRTASWAPPWTSPSAREMTCSPIADPNCTAGCSEDPPDPRDARDPEDRGDRQDGAEARHLAHDRGRARCREGGRIRGLARAAREARQGLPRGRSRQGPCRRPRGGSMSADAAKSVSVSAAAAEAVRGAAREVVSGPVPEAARRGPCQRTRRKSVSAAAPEAVSGACRRPCQGRAGGHIAVSPRKAATRAHAQHRAWDDDG